MRHLPLADATILGMTKADLIDYVRSLEKSRDAAHKELDDRIEDFKNWKPIKHSQWIPRIDRYGFDCFDCENCNKRIWGTPEEFCPGCGCEMNKKVKRYGRSK